MSGSTRGIVRSTVRRLAAAGLVLAALGTQAVAAPVELPLKPPRFKAGDVCARQDDIPTIHARWQSMDGALPKGLKMSDLIGDGERFLRFAPEQEFELADRMFRFAVAKGPQDVSDRASVDLLRLHLDAGKLTTENATELVKPLLAGTAGRSAAALYALGLVTEAGAGVAKDQAKADDYFRAAAAGGFADALIRSAATSGSPKTELTLAFARIVGKPDPEICNRLKRVARYYEKGEIVVQDRETAVLWLEAAADLGDADASWQVAKYHLRGELIDKKEDKLVRYLGLAAERGVPSAMLELGRRYRDRATSTKDFDLAAEWLGKAAQTGSTPATNDLLSLYAGAADEPRRRAVYEKLLRSYASAEDPTPNALTALAQFELETRGRIAGRDAAVPLLEKAVAKGSVPAGLLLARLLVESADPAREAELVSLLETSASQGNSDAMLELARYHTCHTSTFPDVAESAEWIRAASMAGNSTVLSKRLGVASDDPTKMTEDLERQAESGSGLAVAMLVDAYDTGALPAPDPKIDAFWRGRMMDDPVIRWRYAQMLEARDPGKAAELMRSSAKDGVDQAEIVLAEREIAAAKESKEPPKKALDVLRRLAMSGNGTALGSYRKAVSENDFAAFMKDGKVEKAIVDGGDARAFLTLAEFEKDDEAVERIRTAAALSDCSTGDALSIAGALAKAGPKEEAARWLALAESDPAPKGWMTFRMGSIAEQIEGKGSAKALDYYRKGVENGDYASFRRYFEIVTSGDAGRNAAEAERLVEAATKQEDGRIPFWVGRTIPKLDDDLKSSLGGPERTRSLYRQAAEKGHVLGMREYAMLLQRGSGGPADPEEAAKWLEKASAEGDRIAMVALAKAYGTGQGVAFSEEKAKELLALAKTKGSGEADNLLQAMNDNGDM